MSSRPTGLTTELRNAWNHVEFESTDHFVLLASILRVHELAAARMSELLAAFDLRRGDYLLLTTLMFADGTMAPAELSRTMLVHPATITVALDRLEQRGMVERATHPSDRRSTLARITADGRELASKASGALADARFGLGALTPAQAVSISRQLDKVWTALSTE